MNRLDRAIAAFSPRWGLKRQIARIQSRQIETITRRGQTRRNPDAWRVNDPAARRLEVQQGRPLNRHDRAVLRHVFEVNPFAVKTKSSLLNNLIGYGITGTVKGTKSLQKTWRDWIEVCDFDGIYDLYGLQALIADIWLDDGEVFIVKRIVAGAAVHPLRLQVLDVEMLDVTATLASARIRDGIEYDGDGKPAFYHFKRSRELGSFGDPVRVPADQVIHLFHRTKSGQWRGRPHFESVLDVVTDMDDYLEAEGIRKKISACFVGFRALGEDAEDPNMGTINPDGPPVDPSAPPEEAFYPGMIINGRRGETMTFGEPKSDAGIGEYMRWGGLRMAAGARTTYERATGDLSNVNYTSFKAGDLEFQRFIGRLQWLLFIPRLCKSIERAWVDAAYATGIISARRPTFKWTPPAFGTVDLGKDVKAKRDQMAAGFESLRNIVAEFGYDLDELSDEIVNDIAMMVKKLTAANLESLIPTVIAAMFGAKPTTGGNDAGTQPADG